MIVCLFTLLGLLITYGLFILVDVYRTSLAFSHLLDEDLTRRAPVILPSTYTSFGESMSHNYIKSLFSISQFEDRCLSKKLSESDPTERPVDQGFENLQGLSSMLDPLRSASKALHISLVYPQGLENEVNSCGIAGRRFFDLLESVTRSRTQSGSTNFSGFFDVSTADPALGAFYAFNVRYLLVFTLSLRQSSSAPTVFIGFSDENYPSPEVCANLKESIVKLLQAYESQKSIRELGHKAFQAEQRSKAREEFLAHISHDMRSPVHNLKIIVSLIKETCNGIDSDLFAIAEKNCLVLEDTIEGILDFNKHSAGSLVANQQKVGLNQLLIEMFESYRITAQTKDLRFSYTIPEHEIFLSVDERQIRRVLSNLLSNALKYTDAGSVELVCQFASGGAIEIIIRDTGCGISEDAKDLLYDPFTRFNVDKEGVGLGLTVSKLLVELNNGLIDIKSKTNGGTSVHLLFPSIAKASNKPAKKEEAKLLPAMLYIHPDSDAALHFKRQLSQRAVQVYSAGTVPDAVGISNFARPDIVIMDDSFLSLTKDSALSFIRQKIKACMFIIMVNEELSSEKIEKVRGAGVHILSQTTTVDALESFIKEQIGEEELLSVA